MFRSTRNQKNNTPIIVLGVIVLVLIAIGGKNVIMGNAPLIGASVKDVEKIVKKTIDDNPEWIIESLTKHQKKQYKEAQVKSDKAVKEEVQEIKKNKIAPFAGNPDGDVTIVAFFDYFCSYCRSSQKTLNELLAKDKGIKILYKELPILSEESKGISETALAIYLIDPSKYVDFHDAAMAVRELTPKAMKKIVKSLGISSEELEKSKANPQIKEEIEKIGLQARKIGVQGIPAYVVGDQLYPGSMSLSDFESKIAAAREKKVNK